MYVWRTDSVGDRTMSVISGNSRTICLRTLWDSPASLRIAAVRPPRSSMAWLQRALSPLRERTPGRGSPTCGLRQGP